MSDSTQSESSKAPTIPICGGYDDEGMDALLELAEGDKITANETSGTLTRKDPVTETNQQITWARVLVGEDEARHLLTVRLGEGTYIYTEVDGKWGKKEEVQSLSIAELADVGWCEVCTVYIPTGGDHPADETHHIRANDQDEAKQKLEGRTPPIDYYAAIYTDVAGKLEIIKADLDAE